MLFLCCIVPSGCKKNRSQQNKIILLILYIMIIFLSVWSTTASTSIQKTTSMKINIGSSFSGKIDYDLWYGILLDNTLYTSHTGLNLWWHIFLSWTYTYLLSGSTQQSSSWTIFWWIDTLLPVFLFSNEWLTTLTPIFISMHWSTSGDLFVAPNVLIYLDTSAPSLPTYLQWPVWDKLISKWYEFNRNNALDIWVWLHHYHIQLSQDNNFFTTLQFSTTWNNLELSAWSLTIWTRYWRLVTEDFLWQKNYSPTYSFVVVDLPPSRWNKQAINHDTCPNGDKSTSPYDGICSHHQVSTLINIRPKQDEEEQTSAWIINPIKTIQHLINIDPRPTKAHIFPNYTTPVPYTIYEYPFLEILPIETIYEDSQDYNTTRFQRKDNNPLFMQTAQTSFSTQSQPHDNYLISWYNNRKPLCMHYFQACLIIPHCPDVYSDCHVWALEYSCPIPVSMVLETTQINTNDLERCVEKR